MSNVQMTKIMFRFVFWQFEIVSNFGFRASNLSFYAKASVKSFSLNILRFQVEI